MKGPQLCTLSPEPWGDEGRKHPVALGWPVSIVTTALSLQPPFSLGLLPSNTWMTLREDRCVSLSLAAQGWWVEVTWRHLFTKKLKLSDNWNALL